MVIYKEQRDRKRIDQVWNQTNHKFCDETSPGRKGHLSPRNSQVWIPPDVVWVEEKERILPSSQPQVRVEVRREHQFLPYPSTDWVRQKPKGWRSLESLSPKEIRMEDPERSTRSRKQVEPFQEWLRQVPDYDHQSSSSVPKFSNKEDMKSIISSKTKTSYPKRQKPFTTTTSSNQMIAAIQNLNQKVEDTPQRNSVKSHAPGKESGHLEWDLWRIFWRRNLNRKQQTQTDLVFKNNGKIHQIH